MIHHQLHHLRKHKNILYGYVILLFTILIVSFLTMTAQVTKISSELDITKKNFEVLLSAQAKDYEQKLNDSFSIQDTKISNIATIMLQQREQQILLAKDLSFIKSSTGDFSSVVDTALKSVVSIATPLSTGTGFVVHPIGLVVTNYHVVANASSISVLSHDGKIYSADMIGTDIPRDVALLYIQNSSFSVYLPFADSSKVQQGQKVIAIGNPLGFTFSVTEGIVSGLNRAGPTGLNEYIQTDVPLNPGNSGGPVIDKDGNVIGIANFKIGDSEGISFALESNVVKSTLNSMLNKTLFV